MSAKQGATPEPDVNAEGEAVSSGRHRPVTWQGGDVCDTCVNVLGLNIRWDQAPCRSMHEHDGSGCYDCPCNAAPPNSLTCTCPPVVQSDMEARRAKATPAAASPLDAPKQGATLTDAERQALYAALDVDGFDRPLSDAALAAVERILEARIDANNARWSDLVAADAARSDSGPLADPESAEHDFVGVAGHPDDDECTHRSDGTDATYCGRSRVWHDHHPKCYQNTGTPDGLPDDLCDCRVLREVRAALADTTGGGS